MTIYATPGQRVYLPDPDTHRARRGTVLLHLTSDSDFLRIRWDDDPTPQAMHYTDPRTDELRFVSLTEYRSGPRWAGQRRQTR